MQQGHVRAGSGASPFKVSQCCKGLQLGYPWVEVILLEHHVRGTLNGILWEGRNELMTQKKPTH